MLKRIFKNINYIQIRHKYKRFNKQNFKKKGLSKKLVLVEFNAFNESHICQSLFANFLSKKFNLDIVSYFNYCILSAPLRQTFFQFIKWNLGKLLNFKYHGIYKSFGSKKVIRPSIDKTRLKKETKLSKFIFSKIKTKKDILKIKVDNILIGDLIFDTYLKSNQVASVNIKDEKFYTMLKDFIHLFFYWKNFFDKNPIHSIVGVHSVYSYGIPLRIAISENVNAYTVNSRELNKITNKNLFPSTNFSEFPKRFKLINKELKITGLKKAKKILLRRVSGKAGVSNHLISNISSFHSKKQKRIIKKTKRIKVLICTRNVFDATHVYGKLLFTDNSDWLNFLGKISNRTNYDWYLKTHINLDGKFKLYQPNSNKIIFSILKKYKNIKILPNNYSHKQIISEKVDFVLTQHGSVGFEYPLFKIPVINSSYNNPQVGYKFNLNPKNIYEYERLLLNLKKIKQKKFKIDKKKIYEFYFMRYLYIDRNWLFNDQDKMVKSIGGWDNMMNENFYEYSMKILNSKKINSLNVSFNNFLKSNYQSLNIEDTKKIL